MRQLDNALELLADRAETLPTDLLVERLEAQLSAERHSSAPTAPGAAMGHDDAAAVSLLARWRGPLIAVGTAAAIVAVVAVSTFILRGDRADVVEEPTPTTTIPVATTLPTSILPGSSAPAPIDEILGIAVAGDALWASTQAGIVRWDLAEREATLFAPGDDLPFAEGASSLIAIAPDGTVWAATWNQDLARFDGTRWSEPAGYDQIEIVNPRCKVNEDCENPIHAVAVGSDGLLSLAVGSETLLQFDGIDWDVVPVTSSGGAGDVAIAPDGTLWMESRKELLAYDGDAWTQYTVPDNLASRRMTSLAVAPNGDVWAGTAELEGDLSGSVARFDGDSWTVFGEADGLSAKPVGTLTVGSDGTVWAVHGAFEETGIGESPASGGVSWFDGTRWSSTTISDVGFGFGWGNAAVDDTGTLWTTSFWGVVGFDGTEKIVLQFPERAEPLIEAPPYGSWDPILSTTVAKTALPAATCPAGSNPNAPGPIDQARPSTDWGGNQSAVFDRHTGRIVHVSASVIWTLDVCTNTWERLNPSGSPDTVPPGHLVYDVDSDRIVSVGQSSWVYDPTANSWSSISNPIEIPSDDPDWWWAVGGAVFDPVSGLILAQHDSYEVDTPVLSAYDVDTDQWTRVGPLDDSTWRNLIGYSAQTDRLIFAGYRGGIGIGDRHYSEGPPLIVDPRTGTRTETGRGPDITGGFTILNYATDTATAFVQSRPNEAICWFDSATLTWDNCFDASGYPPEVANQPFSAMVGDPINNRLVPINPQGSWNSTEEDPAVSAVWAIELDTGQWIELLAPPSP